MAKVVAEKFIPDDVGGGPVRQDVQDAIRRELDYRLGKGDVPGALKRWEKELIFAIVAEIQPNFALSVLHAEAAVQAGARIEQVRNGLMVPVLQGMLRWKMAGQWALVSAEKVAGKEALKDLTEEEKKRTAEIRDYVRRAFHMEFPDMWEKLARVAPGVLDGYMRIRGSFVQPDPIGDLPKRMTELLIVVGDICSPYTRGHSPDHAIAAVKAGGTLADVVETVAMTMIPCGIPIYLTAGRECIEAVEKELGKK
ncbi:MAG: hypothetical protein HYX96_01920 [Chloroflexi bacterium]|nr:hypothetical protein [Chloroflexota bacterium]